MIYIYICSNQSKQLSEFEDNPELFDALVLKEQNQHSKERILNRPKKAERSNIKYLDFNSIKLWRGEGTLLPET